MLINLFMCVSLPFGINVWLLFITMSSLDHYSLCFVVFGVVILSFHDW